MKRQSGRRFSRSLIQCLASIWLLAGLAGGPACADSSDPLIKAAGKGDLAQIKALLAAGHKVDAPACHEGYDSQICTNPAYEAIQHQQIEALRLLLQSGANPDFTSFNGWTLLNQAISSRNLVMVQELIKYHAKIDTHVWYDSMSKDFSDCDQCTPLDYAVQAGSLPIVRLLAEQLPQSPTQFAALFAIKNSHTSENLAYIQSRGFPYAKDAGYLNKVALHFWPELAAQMLKQGARIDATENEDKSALMTAAQVLSYDGMMFLLGQGANPLLRDKKGQTADYLFDIACAEDCVYFSEQNEKTKLNKAQKAKIKAAFALAISQHQTLMQKQLRQDLATGKLALNAPGPTGATPLLQALVVKDADLIKNLVAKGADPNREDRFGYTPLTWAARFDGTYVPLLLQLGADPNRETRYGTPLLLAVLARDQATTRALLDKGARPNQGYSREASESWRCDPYSDCQFLQNETPLLYAVKGGNLELFKLLVAHGAKTRDPKLMQAAIDGGFSEIVGALLQQGSDQDGRTSILNAALKQDWQSVDKLLTAGAPLDGYSSDHDEYSGGGMVLTIMLHNKVGTPLIEKALVHGADPNKPSGCTVLGQAVYGRDLEAIKLLLAHGLACNTVGSSRQKDSHYLLGRPPIELAIVRDDDLSSSQLEFGPETASQLEIMKYLIDRGAPLDHFGFKGKTPLMWACSRKFNKIAALLIDKGSPVNQRIPETSTGTMWDSGKTALMFAAESASLDTVGKLIEHGANLEIHDDLGLTALMHVSKSGQLDRVEFLLAKGANLNAQDKEGLTPLMHAINLSQVDTVKALLAHHPDLTLKDAKHRSILKFAQDNLARDEYLKKEARQIIVLVEQAMKQAS